MRSSTRMLLGLLAIVILGILVVNVVLKHQLDKYPPLNVQPIQTQSADTVDSIAMEEALQNR